MIDWTQYDDVIVETIHDYIEDIDDKTEEFVASLVRDMISAKKKHNLALYNEYFKFGFFGMSEELRNTYVGPEEYKRYMYNSVEGVEDYVLKSKASGYEVFKDYFHRDVIVVRGFEDYQKFAEFASLHDTFIVKENNGSLGANISKISITENTPIKTAFFKILQYGECVVEEWITQCDEFAQFNDSSVNTVRITTFYDDNKLSNVYGMFRTGRKDSVVDNASKGGIAAAVDLDTGIIISDGYTKKQEHYEVHPDSGIKYKGFQIPRWNEVMAMIEDMHKLCPELKLVGWDMTLTPAGWVMIEGNSKPNIDTIQLILGHSRGYGLRKEIMSTIGRYK